MSPPFQRGKLPETSQWQIEHQKKLLLFFENQKKAKAEIAPQAGPAVEEDEDNEEEEDDEDDPRPAVTSIPKGVLYYAKFAQEKGWIENVRDFQEELFPLDKHQFHEYLDFHAGPESKIRSRGTFHLYMTHVRIASAVFLTSFSDTSRGKKGQPRWWNIQCDRNFSKVGSHLCDSGRGHSSTTA